MRINLTESDLNALVEESRFRGFRSLGLGPEAERLTLRSRISVGKALLLETQAKARLALIDQLTAESEALTEQINQLQQQLAN
jgi:hypothetical protein